MLPPDLRQTLVMMAQAMHDARDPWWVISSAAVALHGVAAVKVADVDVVTSVEDARRVMARLGVGPAKESASLMFRSTVFGQWKAPPLMVEIMAGFHVMTASGWTEVIPRTRVPMLVEEAIVYVPDRVELAEMLRLFGRPKDLERVRLLT
ncbi:conserved hypothetical protein [Sphingomonas aurantiaca]|uniref:Nucleotidyltransferase family protein n=1 Tax=Sphingomonas aurantiaca TaxID=185949 RepID=A0A5E7YWE8_9SPHN|nr:hypothetical protein [Sphingomonas aurantiaca]VVT10716.1 conserved hypothetical protein [Sphingomonas aurantiaca]